MSDLVFTVIGVGALLAALLPRLLEGRRPVSLPIVFLLLGAVLGLAPGLPRLDPLREAGFVEHLTEVTVIVALMGAGLALDRPPGWRRWSSTWRLLGITMPLTIAAIALLGGSLLALAPAAAVLLGAALAPTDPVLASEVQVGEPATEEVEDLDEAEDEVRFGLTSEAGLNDALAFPFVYAAIAMAEHGADPRGWIGGWLGFEVLYKLGVGLLSGLAVGWLLGLLFFSSRRRWLRLSEHSEGFVALTATFLAYGLTEVVQGYGFLAVFVAAVTIRGSERFHGYHAVLHDFIEQIERLLTILVLLLLGAAAVGGMLSGIGWRELAFVALVLLVVRPAAGLLGLAGGRGTRSQRAAIAFFGVRGVGSIYYVAYGLGAATFAGADDVFAVVGLVVIGSVLLHGTTAGPVMARLEPRVGTVGRREN
ncbi:MAG: Na+/H+ antiporter [uncultured Nocardioidaceae bacterium]|uniref:Na+/H+ antiporter n=1 Tax=uncultured Nocardioidaceae bacterium TaxID=253824 RepID=A0A6J4M8X7_9ACTN|nr:MAG: Na+/H+ antiporter [uncultured Nocardioidaceae bacterium]